MTVKLTLELEEGAIERGKVYARNRKVSLSKVVEVYFLGLTDRGESPTPRPTGVVAELAGILAGKDVDLSDEGRALYLARKYS
ncbi:MAG TPA: DUF6364 family protein [Thermoanaerobaculia bacterium]|nr:DUF6364 family protein [Thermoanaerobaculia bacterium]